MTKYIPAPEKITVGMISTYRFVRYAPKGHIYRCNGKEVFLSTIGLLKLKVRAKQLDWFKQIGRLKPIIELTLCPSCQDNYMGKSASLCVGCQSNPKIQKI